MKRIALTGLVAITSLTVVAALLGGCDEDKKKEDLLAKAGASASAAAAAPDAAMSHVLGSLARRWLYRAGRWPMAAVTYVFTQTSTHAARDLDRKLAERDLDAVQAAYPHGQGFQVVSGRKPVWQPQP